MTTKQTNKNSGLTQQNLSNFFQKKTEEPGVKKSKLQEIMEQKDKQNQIQKYQEQEQNQPPSPKSETSDDSGDQEHLKKTTQKDKINKVKSQISNKTPQDKNPEVDSEKTESIKEKRVKKTKNKSMTRNKLNFDRNNNNQDDQDMCQDQVKEDQDAVLFSDDEENQNQNQNQNLLQNLLVQEKDVEVSSGESDQEDAPKQPQKNVKKKKRTLDDSFSMESAEIPDSDSNFSDSKDDSASECSEESPEKVKKSGKRRRPLETTGTPSQRKQRKDILDHYQLKNIKFPMIVSTVLTILSPGKIIPKKDYHSKYNFFPAGYKCQKQYASCIHKDSKTIYTSEVLEGKGGPTFRVTAEDDTENRYKQEHDSSSACWKNIAAIAMRLQYGTKKVSVSGPEFFGLQNQTIQQILENLPDAEKCMNYYARETLLKKLQKREEKEKENESAESD